MEEKNGLCDKIREAFESFESRIQKVDEENDKIEKENEKIRKENEEIRKEIKEIKQENERFSNKLKKIKENIARINNTINLFSINNSINESLFDSLQENINNDRDEILNKLEEVELNEQFKNKEENKCAICLEIFSIGDKVSYLPCFHYFHSSCIKNWIKIRSKCPFCNNIIKL